MYMQTTPIMVLRYGTYVETAAPFFSWPFLQQIVVPTLVDAQTGKHTLGQNLLFCTLSYFVK